MFFLLWAEPRDTEMNVTDAVFKEFTVQESQPDVDSIR